MTGLKAQKLGACILANSVQKNPRLMGQRQEAVLHADIPNLTVPKIKEVEISKFWTGRDWCSCCFGAWCRGDSKKYT